MFLTRKHLSRRTLLRGTGVKVGATVALAEKDRKFYSLGAFAPADKLRRFV